MQNSYNLQESNNGFDLPDVNRVIIAGELLYDPPIRNTRKGVPVTNFVICTQPDPEIVEPDELRPKKCYISVVVWAQKAVFCHENLRKGTPVMIIGELQSMPNFAPERGYYPVQVNAKWIQVLSKIGNREAIVIEENNENQDGTEEILRDSSNNVSKQSNVAEENQQSQLEFPQNNLDSDEPLKTDNGPHIY